MTCCPHCRALAVSHRSRAWVFAHALAWVYAFVSVLGASLVGPFIVGLVPLLLLGGTCLVAETHRRASAPGECDACGKYVWRHRGQAVVAPVRTSSVAHAHRAPSAC